MVVNESELLEKGCIVHDKIDYNKEINKETNVISLNEDLDVSSSKHGTTDSSSLFSSDASIEDPHKEEEEEEEEEKEHKFVADFKGITNDTPPPKDTTEMMEREANYNTDVIPRGIPITNESPSPIERNDGSHESSLLIVHPETSSFETKKPSRGKNLSQEKILETKKPQKEKMECGGKTNSPNATGKQSNALHRSTGSDSSSYSFAFPILVPIEPQHASRKTDAKLQGRSSFSRDEPYLEGDNSISRPQPPSRKKHLCCFCCCFPCQTSSPKCFFC